MQENHANAVSTLDPSGRRGCPSQHGRKEDVGRAREKSEQVSQDATSDCVTDG